MSLEKLGAPLEKKEPSTRRCREMKLMSPLTFAFEYPFVERRWFTWGDLFTVSLLSYAHTNARDVAQRGAVWIVLVRKVPINGTPDAALRIAVCIVAPFFPVLCAALITGE